MRKELEDQLNQGLYVPISIVTCLRNNVPYLTILNLYKQGKVSGIDISGCPLLVNLDEVPRDIPSRGIGRPKGSKNIEKN